MKILFGALLTLVLLVLAVIAVAKLGVVPVSADGTHSRFEARIMPSVLHASVARHAPSGNSPLPASVDNLKAGIEVYKSMCARCHSVPGADPSSYGQAFYPPAPSVLEERSSYTEAQLFWLIKHGIRNTGMPAWGNMLSDEEIWQVVTLIENSQHLPPSVEEEWNVSRKKPAR